MGVLYVARFSSPAIDSWIALNWPVHRIAEVSAA